MRPIKVFISTSSFGKYDPEPLELLKRNGFEILTNTTGRTLKSEEIVSMARGCYAIIAGTEIYDRATLSRCDGLKIISRCGAGLDGIDFAAAKDLGIDILSTPRGPTQAVAELTLGLILNLIRQVELCDAELKRGRWTKEMGFLIGELKFGIIGLGKIGKRVAELLRAFDATVIGTDLLPDQSWALSNQVTLKERAAVISESDVLCLHLPYEPALHHLIGAAQIASMKSGSFLINTSRGGLIDEAAMLEALRTKHLRGAAIDTFEAEPYVGPLRQLENVILTPHIGSYARGGRVNMERESVENVLQAMRNLKLLKV
jgi:D-3-phosphoglycerate dehydrogenase